MTATESRIETLEDAQREAGNNLPTLDWIKLVANDDNHELQQMAKDALELLPEVWVVKIDETQYWQKGFLRKHNIKRIFGVYAFNRSKHVHAAELTPSYELNYLDKQFQTKDGNYDKAEEIEEQIRLNSIDEESVRYQHVSNVEKWMKNPQCLIKPQCDAFPPKGINIGMYKVSVDALEDNDDLLEEMHEIRCNGL